MAFRINHNIPALNALRNLNTTDGDMTTTLERLSSGLKVNRGADGPATLVISEQMRGQIASIEQAIRNSEASVSMVQTAEATLTEINNLLIGMRQLAIHAANEGANDERMLAADQAEISNSLDTIDRIALSSQFGTRTLFDGSNGANGVAVGDGIQFVDAEPYTKSSPAEGYAVNITSPATAAEKRGVIPITIDLLKPEGPGGPLESFQIMISEGGKNIKFSTDSPSDTKPIGNMISNWERGAINYSVTKLHSDLQDYISQRLQQLADSGGLDVEIFVDRKEAGTPGILVVRHKKFGSEHSFSVSSTKAGILSSDADMIESALPGRDVEGTIDGNIGVGRGEFLHAAKNTEADGLVVKYNATSIIKQRIPRFFVSPDGKTTTPNPEANNLSLLAPPIMGARILKKEEDGESLVITWEGPADVEKDLEGYVHVTQNSLAFQVGPTRGHQVKISLLDAKSDQLVTNIPNLSRFESLRDVDVTNSQGAQDAILLIDDAITQMASLRAELGAFQKNTLESNTNSMRVSHENLTSAESSLRDADMAEEMSRFTRNQIMLSSGIAMLAQANQTPRSVLQLLGSKD